MTLTEKLLKRLPAKYHRLVKGIEAEDGLIDDCKYMLYFNDHVALFGYDETYSYPVKSISEAINVIKNDAMLLEPERSELEEDIINEMNMLLAEIGE